MIVPVGGGAAWVDDEILRLFGGVSDSEEYPSGERRSTRDSAAS